MKKQIISLLVLMAGVNLTAESLKNTPDNGTFYDYYKGIFIKAAAGNAHYAVKSSIGSTNHNQDVQTLAIGKYLDDNNRVSIRKEYSDKIDYTIEVDTTVFSYDALVPLREGGHEGPRPFAGFSYTSAKFTDTTGVVKSKTVSAHLGVQVPITKQLAFEAMYENKVSSKGSTKISGVDVTMYKETGFNIGLAYTF